MSLGLLGMGPEVEGGQRPGSAGTGAQYRPNTAGSMNVTSNANARPGTTGSMGVGGGGSAAAAGLGQPITNDPNDYGFGNGFGTGSGSGGGAGSGAGGGSSARARPRAGTLPGAQNRLTIVNAVGDEIMEEDLPSGGGGSGRSTSGAGAGGTSGQGQGQTKAQTQGGRGSKPWLTAEEEKARLYQQAKAEVERVQGGGAVERAGTPPVRFLSFPLIRSF